MSSIITPANEPGLRHTTARTPSKYAQHQPDRIHAAVAERNRKRELELRRRFQETNGPGPE